MTQWKAAPDHPGYEVSDQGDVRTFWKRGRLVQEPRLLRPAVTKSGYLTVGVKRHALYTRIGVHRLVLWAFRRAPQRGSSHAFEVFYDTVRKDCDCDGGYIVGLFNGGRVPCPRCLKK